MFSIKGTELKTISQQFAHLLLNESSGGLKCTDSWWTPELTTSTHSKSLHPLSDGYESCHFKLISTVVISHVVYKCQLDTRNDTECELHINKWLMTKSGRLCQIYVSKEDTAAHLRFGITLALALLAHLASNVSMCVSSHKSMCV